MLQYYVSVWPNITFYCYLLWQGAIDEWKIVGDPRWLDIRLWGGAKCLRLRVGVRVVAWKLWYPKSFPGSWMHLFFLIFQSPAPNTINTITYFFLSNKKLSTLQSSQLSFSIQVSPSQTETKIGNKHLNKSQGITRAASWSTFLIHY